MITEVTIDSLVNFSPEILLFIMAMVILMAGIFKFSEKYVFHLTVFSIILAFLLGFQNYSNESIYMFNDSIIKREVTDFFNRNDYLNKNENDFPISEFEKEIYINNIHQTVKNFVQPNLNFKTEISIPKETLVIHIRSGDVFEKDWHSMYVQNPLSYFEKLIERQ